MIPSDPYIQHPLCFVFLMKSNWISSLDNKVLYDLGVDKRGFKWDGSKTLSKVSMNELPVYLTSNYEKYSKWLDN